MKILFLSAANSIHTVRWVNVIAERGYEIHLVYNGDHHPDNDKISSEIQLHPLKYCGTLGYYLNAKQLHKLVEQIKPDVINVHYASGYGTLARMARISPILLSIWGSDVYEFPYQSKVKYRILKKNIDYADMLASTSECMAEQLRRVMGNESLQMGITPFGIDLEKFDPQKYPGKKSDQLLVGTIKGLENVYGIDIFIQSIRLLLDRVDCKIRDKIRVEIYGDGSQKEELTALVEQLSLSEYIYFMGRIPNAQVPEVLSRFDVFCAASRFESFGVAIIEAMAMEVPVVVSDAEGLKEVVGSQDIGSIVERNSPEQFADAISKLLEDDERRKYYGQAGRKRVEEFYNWENNVTIMEELYKKIYTIKGETL